MKLPTRIFKRENWYVTSPFGYRYHPISGNYSFHSGVDYGTHCENWAQYALEDGYIFDTVKNHSSYGNYVWVRYPRLNISLLHAHLKSINVVKGQKVDENTIIGYTGMTGNATGIHLHLGMTELGKTKWLNAEEYNYIPPQEFTTGEYKLLVSKAIRTEHKLDDKNIVKVGECYDDVKKNLTSKNPKDNAMYKVGTVVNITEIYIDNTSRVWGKLRNCWIVLRNKNGAPQAEKI